MTPRRRRMWLVAGIVVGVSIAGGLALSAFRQNVTFFFDPSEVAAGKVSGDSHFRLGGMVSRGSVQREPGSLVVHFTVTDFKHDVPVRLRQGPARPVPRGTGGDRLRQARSARHVRGR